MKFISAGREDVDVRMLGSGIKFLKVLQINRIIVSKSPTVSGVVIIFYPLIELMPSHHLFTFVK